MIHITQACVDMLAAAVNECDAMTLAEERRNDVERGRRGSWAVDIARTQHYVARRKAIRDHRNKLVELYVQITGKNPWENIVL